jgi:hypothetical protein
MTTLKEMDDLLWQAEQALGYQLDYATDFFIMGIYEYYSLCASRNLHPKNTDRTYHGYPILVVQGEMPPQFVRGLAK